MLHEVVAGGAGASVGGGGILLVEREAEPPGSHMLEWYDFGRAEWAHVRGGALDFSLGTLLPVGGFYAIYRLLTFEAAVVVVLGWATAVFLWNYLRTRKHDVFSFTTMVLACVKACAGLLSGNISLYLIWPSVENVFCGGLFLGSALLGRPALAVYARRLYPVPADVVDSTAFKHGFLGASLAWAMISIVRAIVRLWLLAQLSVGTYLLVDSMIGWPMYLGVIWFTGWYSLQVLRNDGHLLP